MKWRKNKKTAASLPDSVQRDLRYPVGAPLIAGGDNIYAIYNAISMALVMLKGFEKVQPKKAKQLALVSEVWQRLYKSLQPYSDSVELANASEDDM